MADDTGKGLNRAELEELAVNTIRALAMDTVQKADSGHPGMPMGMADVAYVLWTKFLKHSPADPVWPDRDRFVLSAGHGSALLYSLLHLSGYPLSLEDLKQFRQLGSRTPGHPEHDPEIGIETTTGPLGQGVGNGVGMALAEEMLRELFSAGGFSPIDHYTYAIVSDGDLMEGVASESASLAGHLGLGRLIYFYDDNHITIEGSTDLAFSEDVKKRFESYGWHVLRIDGHDRKAIARATRKAQAEASRPTLIICRTHIAYGSPAKQDTAGSHGSPLGEDEVRATKENLSFPVEPAFLVPGSVRRRFSARRRKLEKIREDWQEALSSWRSANTDKAALWDSVMDARVPDDLAAALPEFETGSAVATRSASGETLQALAARLPGLVGGSADLAPSNNTELKGIGHVGPRSFSGRNLHFGIREHGMGAIMNGMAIHGGLIPYGATFLIFSDYMRPAIRLAAMMKQRVIYVFTHDSIFLGEDGPTHQPIEHAAALRTIPDLTVIRPADAAETAQAWVVAVENIDGPTALLLSRQKLPVLDRSVLAGASGIRQGAYTLLGAQVGSPDILLLASGSEVHTAVEAAGILKDRGKSARVVNMASWELFEKQPESYRQEVLPPGAPLRLAVEAGRSMGWERYTGPFGDSITMERFGASAPYKALAEKFGFTAESIAARASAMIDSFPAAARDAARTLDAAAGNR